MLVSTSAASPVPAPTTRGTNGQIASWLRFAIASSLIATLGLSACNTKKALWQSGLGFAGISLQVRDVTPRGDYLQATLGSDDFSLEVYLPDDEDCRALFTPGAELQYLEGSPGGTYKKEGWECRGSGIGSLREWRNRYPRPRTTGSLVARGLANYQLVYQDEEVAFLSGRFPLTEKIGFVGLDPTIAVVPKTPECEAPIARTNSSMEYYPTGKKILTLVSSSGHCHIIGLIAPFGKGWG